MRKRIGFLSFILLVLFIFTILPSKVVAADVLSYDFTFDKNYFTGNGTVALGTISWTLDGDVDKVSTYDSTKGIHMGTGSVPYKELTFSTAISIANVKKVVLYTSGGSSISSTFTISVGASVSTTKTLTETNTAYEYALDSATSGIISFDYEQGSTSKAIYIKQIQIYTESSETTYNVKYYDGDTEYENYAKTGLSNGSTLTAPTAPTKDNYLFDGWYKEPELTNAWDFAADTVTANVSLYAKWHLITDYEYFSECSTKSSLAISYTQSGEGYRDYLAYSGETTNMSAGNNASLVKLDSSKYTVTATKTGTYYPGLNMSGEIKMYLSSTNTITVTSLETISSILIHYSSDDYRTVAKVYCNDTLLVGVDSDDSCSTYTINSTSFTLDASGGNVNFKSIEILGGDTVTYSLVDAAIRFGGIIGTNAYNANASYGVLVTSVTKLGSSTIASLYNNETTVSAFISANSDVMLKNIDCTSAITRVDATGTADASGDYYQFAAVLKNLSGHYTDKLVAICYMELDGKVYFMSSQSKYSIVTLADYYIEKSLAPNGDVFGILEVISAVEE